MDELRWLSPGVSNPIYEALETHQVTREFHAEVQYRQDFEQYCNWYYATAAENRREHQKMQADFNLLGWFYRGRSLG